MNPELPHRSGRRKRDSFHMMRLTRRVSRRTGREPQRKVSRQAEVRSRRTRILMLLTMALGFELAVVSLTSPLLGLNRIVIRGTEKLTPGEAAVVQQAVTLPPGTNLLRVPMAQMERDLKTLPWLKSARIAWLSPHALRVECKPRPSAVIASIGGQRYEVDESGILIRLARPEQAARLPSVEVQGMRDVHPGIQLHDEALQAAIHIYHDAPSQPMVHIAKIEVDQNANMCLNMKDGIRIQLGQPEELSTKMGCVQRIYEQDPNVAHRMIAINLSYPAQPACTPRNATPPDLKSVSDSSPAPKSGAPDKDSSL